MGEGFANFEKNSGKKARVQIEKGKKLGEGSTANVHEVKATVLRNEKTREISTLVEKQYKDEWIFVDDRKLTAEQAEISMQNYELLKRLHFPVPPTYRIDREKNRIVMTNVGKLYPDSVSITASDGEVDHTFIEEISNIKDIVSEIIEYADGASLNGIELGADAYNLAVPRSGKGEARLFITDLENIMVHGSGSDAPKELREHNIEEALEFLYDYVLVKHVREEVRQPYLAVLGKAFSEKKRILGIQPRHTDEILKQYY